MAAARARGPCWTPAMHAATAQAQLNLALFKMQPCHDS